MPSQPRDRLGVTLPAAMLAMAILSIAGTVMFWMLAQLNFQEFRLERKLKGGRAMANFALKVQSLPSEAARTLCLSPDRFSSPYDSPCPSIDRKTIVGAAPALPLPLDQPLDWNGDPVSFTADAQLKKLCISVLKCTDLADQQMMEIELVGFWVSPDAQSGLVEQRLAFRKVR